MRLPATTHGLLYVALLALMALNQGCVSTPDPFEHADTVQLKAYALERTYNVVLTWGVTLLADPAVPESVKQLVRDAETTTTPTVEALAAAAADYDLLRVQLAAGQTTDERLLIAAANLENWLATAERNVAAFAGIVRR
jgi:hypothetical protein